MIRLSEPSMAMHSHDVPGYKYNMWKSFKMWRETTAHDVVNWILWGINNSPEMYLDNVVINCHGAPGGVILGDKELIKSENDKYEWIYAGNVGLFSPVKNKGNLGTIWLVACEVAKGSKGKNFCSSLAKAAGCNVIAADKIQRVNFGFYLQSCPDNCIDNFEGTAYRWDKQGNQSVYSH
ncbi:MAG: DUF4347 domain-containing protein [Pyrinomonadaceae bacterium]